MKRRVFITLIGGAAAAWPMAARAQQKPIPRLCFLTFDPGTLRTRSPRFDGFFQGLQDLGYVNARNIEISYLSADNNGDRFPALIDECLSLRPDVIAVTTTPAAHLLKKATRDIPIVMVALGDPLGTGLVDSLSRPSENITGMSLMVPEMAVKRLELLRELVPGISRVLVLLFLADPIAPIQVKAMEEAARSLGLILQVQDIRAADDIQAAYEAGSQARAEGVLVKRPVMVSSARICRRGMVGRRTRRPSCPPTSTRQPQPWRSGHLPATGRTTRNHPGGLHQVRLEGSVQPRRTDRLARC